MNNEFKQQIRIMRVDLTEDEIVELVKLGIGSKLKAFKVGSIEYNRFNSVYKNLVDYEDLLD